MKRVLWLVMLGVITYGVFLIAKFPMAVAYQAARAYLPDSVQLYDLQGSLFSGQGTALVADRVTLDPIGWKFHPVSLLKGRLAYQLELNSAAGPLAARIAVTATGTLLLQNVTGQLSLAEALRMGGEDEPRADAWLRPQFEEIRRDRDGRLQISGKLLLQNLVWNGNGQIALGGLVLDPSGEGPPWKIRIVDDGGPVRVTGEAEFGEGNSYRLNVVLTARDTAATDVENILVLLGPADAQGRHLVDMQGQF